MESREIVRRAIEFQTPPRLPFFLGRILERQAVVSGAGFPERCV